MNPEITDVQSSSVAAGGKLLEIARAHSGAAILAAALSKLRIFEKLGQRPMGFEELRKEMRLGSRAMVVLTTSLQEMNTIKTDRAGLFHLTGTSRLWLLRSSKYYLGGYIELMVNESSVDEIMFRLRSNRPRHWHGRGAPFTYRPGKPSPLNHPASARSLTLALAGLARALAPIVASTARLSQCRVLLDVGCGTGLYSFAALQHYPKLKAILLDRPEVLKVAKTIALKMRLQSRVTFFPADMFIDPFPKGVDAVLLSNVLHDWDSQDCLRLVKRCERALSPNGRLFIHDKFQGSRLDTSLCEAIHSANLFLLTEGRLYTVEEVKAWMIVAGLSVLPRVSPTGAGCAVMAGTKK